MASILFNYQKAKEQARQLENTAQELRSLAENSMEDSLQQLRVSWTGENADEYIRKGYILKEEIGDAAEDLREIAESIRAVAKAIYEAEMAAKQIAEKRTY